MLNNICDKVVSVNFSWVVWEKTWKRVTELTTQLPGGRSFLQREELVKGQQKEKQQWMQKQGTGATGQISTNSIAYLYKLLLFPGCYLLVNGPFLSVSAFSNKKEAWNVRVRSHHIGIDPRRQVQPQTFNRAVKATIVARYSKGGQGIETFRYRQERVFCY